MFSLFSRIRFLLALFALLFSWGIFGISSFIIGIISFLVIRFGILSDTFIRESLAEWGEKSHVKSKISRKKSVEATEDEKEKNTETASFEHQKAMEETNKIAPIFENSEGEVAEEKSVPLSNTSEILISDEYGTSVIQRFFRENLLAKLGGILVFLGVLFLMTLIYSVIGPMTKVIIGFVIGFIIYGAGVFLDKKGYRNESRIVLGTGLLVNYLVILAGRYLIRDAIGGTEMEVVSREFQGIFSVGITFVLLILNTVFAVMTGILYQSRTLLVFSFLFAYLNPLLLGASSSDPYTLLGYTMIVTFGAMTLAFFRRDEILLILSIVFASILFLSAPYHNSIEWITKLLCIDVLGVMSFFGSTQFQKKYQHIFEILVFGLFFLIGIMGLLRYSAISVQELLLVGISSLALMIFAYSIMHRGAYLYSIGTFGSALTLLPVLVGTAPRADLFLVSSGLIFVFALLNVGILFFKYTDFLASNIVNIVGGILAGGFFLGYMNYCFGNIYFPGVAQGVTFLVLASIYGLLTFFFVGKIGTDAIRKNEKYQNLFFIFSAIAIGFFTIAIAFLFSHSPAIIALLWLIEANILFFLAQKISSPRTVLLGLVLLIVGIMRLAPFYFGILAFRGGYENTLVFFLILVSLLANVVILFGRSYPSSFPRINTIFHAILHMIGVSMVIMILGKIFYLDSSLGYYLMYIAGVLAGLGIFYRIFGALELSILTNVFSVFWMIRHLNIIFFISYFYQDVTMMQSFVTTLFFSILWIYSFIRERKITEKYFFAIFVVYVFAATSQMIFDFFDTTFAVTMYWGILSFITLGYGIARDILPLRTLGLYFITLTALKVFFYDIMLVEDTIFRVIAFISVGILMILLSMMYTRKYGNTLNQEFSPRNLFASRSEKREEKK